MICLSAPDKIAAIKKLKILISENKSASFPELMKIFYNSAYEDLIHNNQRVVTENFIIELIKYLSQDMHSRLSDYENENQFIQVMNMLSGGNAFSYSTDDMLALQKDENVRELVGLNRNNALPRPMQIEITKELGNIISDIKNTFPQDISSHAFLPKINLNPLFKGTHVKGIKIESGEIFDIVPLFSPSLVANGNLPRNEFDPKIVYHEALEYDNLVKFGIRYFIDAKNRSYEHIKKDLLYYPSEESTYFYDMFAKYISLDHRPHENIRYTNIYQDYLNNFIDDIIYAVYQIEDKYKNYYITTLPNVTNGMFHLYDKNINSYGTIDLVAIKPDGSFIIIDISTSKDKLTEDKKLKSNFKTSVLTHILMNVKSLKSEGKVDIAHLQKDIFLGNAEISKSKKERYIKTNLKAVSFITSDIISINEIKEKFKDYKEKFFNEYNPLQIPKLEEVTKPITQKPKFGNLAQRFAAEQARRAAIENAAKEKAANEGKSSS